MSFEHVDHAVTKKLVNTQEVVDGKFVVKQKEWNSSALKNDAHNIFKKIPFYDVPDTEWYVAGKAIDDFVYDNYDQTVVDAWEEHDHPPETLESDILKKYPASFSPYLNTIKKKLQNKYCSYSRLKEEMPEFPGLKVWIWSGHEVKNAFEVNRKTYFSIIIMRGRVNDMDAFMRRYGI